MGGGRLEWESRRQGPEAGGWKWAAGGGGKETGGGMWGREKGVGRRETGGRSREIEEGMQSPYAAVCGIPLVGMMQIKTRQA